MRRILLDLEHEDIAEELRSLWFDFEDIATPEAAIARELDTFETVVQANDYEVKHPEKRLDSYFLSEFKHPEVRRVSMSTFMCDAVICQLHFTQVCGLQASAGGSIITSQRCL